MTTEQRTLAGSSSRRRQAMALLLACLVAALILFPWPPAPSRAAGDNWYKFTNATDPPAHAHDLHIEFKSEVAWDTTDPEYKWQDPRGTFTSNKGSGTRKVDLTDGRRGKGVAAGASVDLHFSFAGADPPEVKDWYWTDEKGNKLPQKKPATKGKGANWSYVMAVGDGQMLVTSGADSFMFATQLGETGAETAARFVVETTINLSHTVAYVDPLQNTRAIFQATFFGDPSQGGDMVVLHQDSGGTIEVEDIFFNLNVTDLGTLGGDSSMGADVNSAGQVVGTSTTPTATMHAFLWDTGVITDLGTLGGDSSAAYALNDLGVVVGAAQLPGGETHACRWEGGMAEDLGTLGGESSVAFDVDFYGNAVGQADTGTGMHHASLWSFSMPLDLGTLGGDNSIANAINGFGQIAGTAQIASGAWHACLWDDGPGVDLGTLGGDSSAAYGINQPGQVVGGADTPAGNEHAFLWEQTRSPDGTMLDLGTLGGDSGRALDINTAGQVVGTSAMTDTTWHAFIYGLTGMLDLNDLVPEGPGWELIEASAINDAGQIAGSGTLNGEPRAFLMTLEPITAALEADPVWGIAPLTVYFGNMSDGDFTESFWQFGDGETNTNENPTHTYLLPGEYTVTLTVAGPLGQDAVTRTDYIIVVEGYHVYLPVVVCTH